MRKVLELKFFFSDSCFSVSSVSTFPPNNQLRIKKRKLCDPFFGWTTMPFYKNKFFVSVFSAKHVITDFAASPLYFGQISSGFHEVLHFIFEALPGINAFYFINGQPNSHRILNTVR